MSFSTLAQFGAFGLRREVLLPRMRAVTVVDPDTDTLGVGAHDWAGDEYIMLATVPGSVDGGDPVLPTGLSATTVYRPLPVTGSDSLFNVSLTEGGSAVAFGPDSGAGSFTVTEQLSATIQRHLDMARGRIVQALIAYSIGDENPDPTPPILVWVECKLAAFSLAVGHGLVVPGYFEQARQTIEAEYKEAVGYLERWRLGEEVQGLGDDATPGESENGTFIVEAPAGQWFTDCNGELAVS